MSANITALVHKVSAVTQEDGALSILDGQVQLFRNSAPVAALPCMYFFGLGITLRGSKNIMVGEKTYEMEAGGCLLSPAELPVITSITRARKDAPFLGIFVHLDLPQMTQLAAEAGPLPSNGKHHCNTVPTMELDGGIANAVERLVDLHNSPDLAQQLFPVIRQEIMIRLLHGPYGATLRQIITSDSPMQKIMRILSWLKNHFADDFTSGDLAGMAHMSSSTFREHFKAVTGMSPMQYLKQIRLLEARQLMFNDKLDASSAAFEVGYESPSQFSREYSRMFGTSPVRDIRRLRERVNSAPDSLTGGQPSPHADHPAPPVG
ncbi:AraC family transcriptional regulator [Thalassospira sp. MA62]|nr:AraC family transcriptional regulator [Thalassospira sp. MA62]